MKILLAWLVMSAVFWAIFAVLIWATIQQPLEMGVGLAAGAAFVWAIETLANQ